MFSRDINKDINMSKTEMYEDPLTNFELKNDVKSDTFTMFYEVNKVHSVIFASVIFCVGLVLNALILRCYWSVKTSTAVYIIVLAFIDIAAMIFMISTRTADLLFPCDPIVMAVSKLLANLILFVASVLGPLFMALDRILIVAFPHSFKRHEKRMRIAKIIWTILQSSYSVIIWILGDLIGFNPMKYFWIRIARTLAFTLPCVLCVLLYAVIVAKVRASQKQIQPTTHIAAPNL